MYWLSAITVELRRVTHVLGPRAFQEQNMFHTKELITKSAVFGSGGYLELECVRSKSAAEITCCYAILGS